MSKRIITIISTLFLVFSLTACGTKNNVMDETEDTITSNTEDIMEENGEEEEIIEDYEKITDFEFSLDEVHIEDVATVNTVIDMGGTSAYHIKTNHIDDIYEINFYKISSINNNDKDFELQNREYFTTYQNCFPMDNAFVLYDIPNKPNYIFSFLMKNNQIFEFYIQNSNETINIIPLDSSLSNNLVQYINE